MGTPGNKAIVLGSVLVGNSTYNLICLTGMDAFTGRVGPGGIRLFHAQFIKLLRNANIISEAMKAVQREEILTSQLLLGDGVYVYISLDEPQLDIRYYKSPFSREDPTDLNWLCL